MIVLWLIILNSMWSPWLLFLPGKGCHEIFISEFIQGKNLFLCNIPEILIMLRILLFY